DSLQEEAPVYRQRPQAALRRSRRGRRRHLVTLFLPRPTGTHRRAGLHHQDLTEVSPMLPVYSVTYLPGCSEYAALKDLRDVLAHRGTPPRLHMLATHGPDIPSGIPSNLRS